MMVRRTLRLTPAVPRTVFFTFFIFLAGIFTLHGQQPFATMITDQVGRKMSVPDDLKRVVSLAPSITEIIFALARRTF